MSLGGNARVLAIALDSAEPDLIERWMNDGTLPTLKRLRSRGGYGRLKSSAEWLAGSPWPTFYTGTDPGHHGIYHSIQWRADLMQHVYVSPDWLPSHPFWREFSRMGPRVISIDLPMTYSPEPFNGLEICGWSTHDRLSSTDNPISYPVNLVNRIRQEFGLVPTPIRNEVWGVQKVKSLLKLRDQLIEATYTTADLARRLMISERWNLFMVSFASPHRGGHKLWDLSGTYGRSKLDERKEFANAMRDIYVACDTSLAKLVETAGDKVPILVFSLHGMGPNTNRTYLLPKVMKLISHKPTHTQGIQSYPSTVDNLKENIPSIWRSMAFNGLPLSLVYYFYSFCRSKLHRKNPLMAPFFEVVTDLNGYVRINLRGREADGIVKPKDFDHFCSNITEAFESLINADTEEPVVKSVQRSNQLFSNGPGLKYLPDLIIRWNHNPAAKEKTITSKQYPSFSISTPRRNLDGRSGNHRPEGFLIALGDGMIPNSKILNGNILDLAPTIYELLGKSKPTLMHGKSLWKIQESNMDFAEN
jgi:predicted AlkP superfamily phosphohydrolase/phosphomutase